MHSARRYKVAATAARRRQAGQALLLTVISLLVLCLGVIVLFNTGQTVSKKTQLTNAADAAAYSAAVQQARAYNLIAYFNRATVANEVAVAQMTSWYSWTNFMLSATEHLEEAIQGLAVLFDLSGVGIEVGVMLQEIVGVLKEVQAGVQEVQTGERTAFTAGVTAIATLNEGYSVASNAIAKADSAEALEIVPQVVSLNTDGKASVGTRGDALLIKDIASAEAFTEQYRIPGASVAGVSSDNAGADRLANVVMEARDGFSKSRSSSSMPLVTKKGGTDLVNYTSWVGADSLDLNILGIDVPLAWGGAAAVARTPISFAAIAKPGYANGAGWTSPYQYDQGTHYGPYDGALSNGNAGRNVLSQPAEDGLAMAWLKSEDGINPGLQNYDDIVPNKAAQPYTVGATGSEQTNDPNDGPIFDVLVEQAMNTVRTSNNVAGIGGPPDFQAQDQAVSNGMTALSSAQTYFSRPRSLFPRVIDSYREEGSLFSPYWQARLVDTPCATRTEVAATYGAVSPSCL